MTKQTGAEGQACNKVSHSGSHSAANTEAKLLLTRLLFPPVSSAQVLINEGIYIDKELYFAILMDRAANGPVVVASKKGGMDIEAVAEEDPDAILSTPIDVEAGMTDEQALEIAAGLGFEGDQAKRVRTN